MAANGSDTGVSGLHLLIAEDEMMLVMMMEDWLAMLNCSVATASRLKDAVALAETGEFDGALLDANLAGERIYPAAEKLLQRGIPLIFMTGYSADMLHADFRDYPIIRKPFLLEDLEKLMAETFVRERS